MAWGVKVLTGGAKLCVLAYVVELCFKLSAVSFGLSDSLLDSWVELFSGSRAGASIGGRMKIPDFDLRSALWVLFEVGG
jgi:hypothetical protein